jgi:hypothetical protein
LKKPLNYRVLLILEVGMMSHKGFTHLVVRSSFIALLMLVSMVSGCVEAGLQSGVYACDKDRDCPPGGFFCDNYFNSYVYLIDVNARPTIHEYWGSCISTNEVVSKEGTGRDRIFTENCSNKVDDDGDGLEDCLDLECQTARACRIEVDEDCDGTENEPAWCKVRLGYPLTRAGAVPPDENNCPQSVGYTVLHDVQDLCLPRCRLYFKMDPSEDGVFGASDQYCNDMYANRFTTTDEFAGSLVCTHLYVKINDKGGKVQHDVCLPRAALTRAEDGCLAGETAIPIEYRDRIMLSEPITIPTSGDRKLLPGLKPADINDTYPDYLDTLRTAHVCVPTPPDR